MQRENETLDVDPIAVQLPLLPNALEGFKIVAIADLHMQRITRYHDAILDALWREKPNLILVAGDTIDSNTHDIPSLELFFTRMAHMAPVVAVLGNNDCDPIWTPQLRAMYGQAGVTLLENETRMLPVKGYAIQITGLQDPAAFARGAHVERKMDQPSYVLLKETLKPKQKEGSSVPSILLIHQPQLATQYIPLKPSLIVAGHAHGGQFRLPLVGGLYAPGQGLFPRLTSGLYTIEDTQMVVSRGLGNHDFPIRLGNRPHIPVITLRKTQIIT